MDARGCDQKSFCEPAGAGIAHGIDGLPGDEHGHDWGLAGARGHFEGQSPGVGMRRHRSTSLRTALISAVWS